MIPGDAINDIVIALFAVFLFNFSRFKYLVTRIHITILFEIVTTILFDVLFCSCSVVKEFFFPILLKRLKRRKKFLHRTNFEGNSFKVLCVKMLSNRVNGF